jgi:hypothetical protein
MSGGRLGRQGLRFDVTILDHTYNDAGDTDHLNAEQFSMTHALPVAWGRPRRKTYAACCA